MLCDLNHLIPTLKPNEIVVSNKLMRLSGPGLELRFGLGLFYMHEILISFRTLSPNMLDYNVRITTINNSLEKLDGKIRAIKSSFILYKDPC